MTKNLNHLHTELSLGYAKDIKFYLESKASFIDIISIASFKLFLVSWLPEYRTFSDSSMVSMKSWPWRPKIHPVEDYFPKKNSVLQSNFFSSSNVFFIRQFLANT